MKKIAWLGSIIIFLVSCKSNFKNSITLKKIDMVWLDSIINRSDSSYTKPYFRTDFVMASYYLNKKDSTLTQLMKDSAGRTRQIIIMKNNTRTFFAQYYANGNIQANLPLDAFGQYHGTGNFYYENGKLQSSGNFNHGLKTGQWKVYDEDGKLTATDNFDKDGQLIQQSHP